MFTLKNPGPVRAHNSAIIFITLVIFACLILSACSKSDPVETLEQYFLEEARLDDFGWNFYTVEQKESGLVAYLSFPPSGNRKAPVDQELRRLCPDKLFHSFWSDTGIDSFDLILMRSKDASSGKAKRLMQLTCTSDFDLISFEQSSVEPMKEVEVIPSAPITHTDKQPNYPLRSLRPDADLESYSIDILFSSNSSLKDSQYEFPVGELERIKALILRFEEKAIDTQGMKVYYPKFVNWFERVPHFERATTSPPDNEKYSKLYYQNGSVRVVTVVEGQREWLKQRIFYNDLGAPVLAFDWGTESSDAYFCSVLEYDDRGYLSRVTHFSNGSSKFFGVSIYRVEPDYDNAKSYGFGNKNGLFRINDRYTHKQDGSYIWLSRTGEERRYTQDRFRDVLNFRGRYPDLSTLIPLPD